MKEFPCFSDTIFNTPSAGIIADDQFKGHIEIISNEKC
jgi:hypothetical protein